MKSTVVAIPQQSSLSSLHLSPRKALAAVLAGVLLGSLSWLAAADPLAVAAFPLAIALAWAAAVDLDRYILPDLITLPLIVAGLLLHASGGSAGLLDASVGAAAGYLSLAGVAWTYERMRGRPGLGLGDAKLLAAAGAWLGWKMLPLVVLAGSLSALACVLFIVAFRGHDALRRAFPFGPFLALAFLGAWIVRPWPFA